MKGKNGHSLFSASSMDRVVACPGSVRLNSRIEPRPESEAASEGTAAHLPLDTLLKNGQHKMLATSEFLRKTFTHEMVIHAENAAKTVWEMAKGRDAEVTSEEKVKLSHIDPECGGTFDAAIAEHFGMLDVVDYKFGKHVPVEVENNAQMLTYAVGKAHPLHYNFERIRLTIIQPRAAHEKGPVRSWVTEPKRLLEWNRTLKETIRIAKKKDAPLMAGKHCFFCDAKKICKAYTPDAIKEMRMSFAKPRTPEQIRAQLVLDFGEPISDTKRKGK